MPMREARSIDVAAAADAAMTWATEMPSNRHLRTAIGCVAPMCVSGDPRYAAYGLRPLISSDVGDGPPVGAAPVPITLVAPAVITLVAPTPIAFVAAALASASSCSTASRGASLRRSCAVQTVVASSSSMVLVRVRAWSWDVDMLGTSRDRSRDSRTRAGVKPPLDAKERKVLTHEETLWRRASFHRVLLRSIDLLRRARRHRASSGPPAGRRPCRPAFGATGRRSTWWP